MGQAHSFCQKTWIEQVAARGRKQQAVHALGLLLILAQASHALVDVHFVGIEPGAEHLFGIEYHVRGERRNEQRERSADQNYCKRS